MVTPQTHAHFFSHVSSFSCHFPYPAIIKHRGASCIENGLAIGAAFGAHAARLPGDTMAPTKAATFDKRRSGVVV